MGVVVLLPVLDRHVLTDASEVVIVQDHELLVGRRLEEELVAFLMQHAAQSMCGIDRIAADLEIQAVGHERLELHADETPLGKKRPVLLDARNGMRRSIARWKHHCLAAERTDLGAADIEDIAQLRKLRQRDVALIGREGVTQTRTVHEQRNIMLVRDLVNRGELVARVERAVLGGHAHIDGTGEHHVFAALVFIEDLDIVFQIISTHLALVAGNGEHLVPAELDGTGLVAGDVARLGCDDALVGCEQHVDHACVGLRAAHQQEHVGLGRTARLADELLRMFAMYIGSVAGQRLHIGIDECLKHHRVRTVAVIVIESEHVGPFSRIEFKWGYCTPRG